MRNCTGIILRNRSEALPITTGMSDRLHPFLVVPASPDFARVFDRDITRIKMAQRAREVGVVVLMPRDVQPATLMFAAMMWPQVLRGTGITRVAVVLHVGAFALAKPLLGGCARRMADAKIQVEFFHEAQVDNGALISWAERSRKRKRVTTDQLVKVCERYADRGDLRNAILALKLAEENAEADEAQDELAAFVAAELAAKAKKVAPTVRLRVSGGSRQSEPPRRETAELPSEAEVRGAA